MNRKDNSPADNQLASYLEGRDGVSGAYRAVSTEEPSAGFDAVILGAARAQLNPSLEQPVKRSLSRYYPVAASLLLGIALGATFVGNGMREEQERSEMARAATSEAASAAAESTAMAPAEAPALAPQQQTQADATAGDVQVARQTSFSQLTNSVAARMVDQPVLPDYRSAQNTWLERIAQLDSEVENTDANLTTLRDALAEEREQFLRRYPDFDLDATLQGMREP